MTEPDPMEVERHSYLWTTHRNDYLLVYDRNVHEPRIINIRRNPPEMKVFTDDGLAAAVNRRMLAAGSTVVTWEEMEKIHARRHGEP